MPPQFWLMKSEPESFGIADLARVQIEPWSGVRNYMARNHMRAMQVGDGVLFHHSSVDPPGVAGLARVARIGVVDETQFDPGSKYYDPKATRAAPIWVCVDVEYVETLPYFVTMDRMRSESALSDIMVLRRGMRLSVQPVSEAEYVAIVRLGHTEPPPEAPRSAKITREARKVTPARTRVTAKAKRAAKAKPSKATKGKPSRRDRSRR